MAKRKKTSSPLPRPPIGTYDPSIDASQRAAQRGYSDLQRDTTRGATRSASDYAIGLADIQRQRDNGLADILRGKTRMGEDINTQGGQISQDYQRSLSDLLSARSRAGEDYSSNIATLDRNYAQLGHQQQQSANAAGVLNGGALAQALQKRTANEAIDRAPIDTGYNRFVADSQQQEQRLGQNRDQAVSALDLQRTRGIQDYGTQTDRLTQQLGTGQSTYGGGNQWADAWLKQNPGQQLPGGPHSYGTAGDQLSLTYQRGAQDRTTSLQRAGRELNAYGQDLIPTRYYSAAGLNPYSPPRRTRKR